MNQAYKLLLVAITSVFTVCSSHAAINITDTNGPVPSNWYQLLSPSEHPGDGWILTLLQRAPGTGSYWFFIDWS